MEHPYIYLTFYQFLKSLTQCTEFFFRIFSRFFQDYLQFIEEFKKMTFHIFPPSTQTCQLEESRSSSCRCFSCVKRIFDKGPPPPQYSNLYCNERTVGRLYITQLFSMNRRMKRWREKKEGSWRNEPNCIA